MILKSHLTVSLLSILVALAGCGGGGGSLWCADADPAYSLHNEPVCQGAAGWLHNVAENPDDVNQPTDDIEVLTVLPQAATRAVQATRARGAVAKKAQHALTQPMSE